MKDCSFDCVFFVVSCIGLVVSSEYNDHFHFHLEEGQNMRANDWFLSSDDVFSNLSAIVWFVDWTTTWELKGNIYRNVEKKCLFILNYGISSLLQYCCFVGLFRVLCVIIMCKHTEFRKAVVYAQALIIEHSNVERRKKSDIWREIHFIDFGAGASTKCPFGRIKALTLDYYLLYCY